MTTIDDTIDEYEKAASIRATDFSQLGIDDFANVEIDSEGNAYGIVMDVPIKINAQTKPAPAPAPAAKAPPTDDDSSSFGSFLGDLNVALDSPFSGLTRGVAKFIGNTAGALGIVDQKDVDTFFKTVDEFNDVATRDNLPAKIGGAVGSLSGQYILPAVTGYNALRALGAPKLLSSIVAEGTTGLLGLSPNDENIFNMLAKDSSSPAVAKVREMLATDPDDPEWTNRSRNAADALLLLGASEALIRGLPKLVQQGKQFIKSDKGQQVVRSVEEMGARADERLGSVMRGETLSANPIGAAGDMALSAAGKLAGRAGGEQVATDLDPQGFFSAVSRAVDAIPMEKGTGAQMRAMIAKGEGVKAEEMAWTGLDNFLAGKQSVTKQEVRDYVDANQVQVEEVVKGAGSQQNIRVIMADDIRESLEAGQVFDVDAADALEEWTGLLGGGQRRNQLESLLEEKLRNAGDNRDFADFAELAQGQQENAVKFGEYTLPGGENYREVLLTLPKKAMTFDEYAAEYKRRAPGIDDATIQERYADYAAAPGDDLSPDTFRGPHYDEPNVLAHIRLNDRTGPNGEKILFVEEIQSDWHQKGRKQGYKTPVPEMDEATQARFDQYKKYRSLYYDPRMGKSESIRGGDPGLTKEYEALENEFEQYIGNGSQVPAAPLKKTWHEMSWRRVARMAAEEGYDAIAWTPGKVQIERYDLRKYLSEIHLSGTNLKAYDLDGKTVIERTGVKPEDLPDLIGKEAADRLMSQEPKGSLRSLTGQELEVGGEGMEGFYDQMLKKYAEKWGKKFGSKVGVTKIEAGGPASVLEVVENEAHWMRNVTGGSTFTVVDRTNGGQVADFGTREAAEKYIKDELADTEVWTMPVTPKMRDTVLKKGVPLFSAAGATAATGAAMQNDNQPASERVF